MNEGLKNKKYIYIRWFLLRLSLILFDILAVNVAYYLALVVRFYVNYEFNIWAVGYVPMFFEFAPYYTVCALAVFAVFGLYKSLWKYAGLSDMNRILGASATTCVIQILGSLLLVGRMPLTYYTLGVAFQFVFIAVSRFSYRLLVLERERFFKHRKHDAVNVLVVGMGESSRTVIKHLERDPESMAKPVCVIDISNTEFNGTMAGIPVLGGTERIPGAVRKYHVDRVLVADTIVSWETREEVKRICKELDVPVQNFSGYFQSVPSRIPLRSMLEYVDGPVVIELKDMQTCYEVAGNAAKDISEKYIVASVCVWEGKLCIRLIQDVLQPNDMQADWVQLYQEETGEDISFF